MTIKITAFKCHFCGKKYEKERAANLHEKLCPKNPKNHIDCFDCLNYKTGFYEGQDFCMPYCEHFEKDILSRKNFYKNVIKKRGRFATRHSCMICPVKCPFKKVFRK